jgi:hypothetical protein
VKKKEKNEEKRQNAKNERPRPEVLNLREMPARLRFT